MRYISVKRVTMFMFIFAMAIIAPFSGRAARTLDDDSRAPELPSQCDKLSVEEGNKVHFHAYALGVQIYRWNGTAWDFVAPEATLFASPNYRGKVGAHYAGPTWESNSGSNVVARRIKGCSADPTAIDLLLLEKVSSDGPGIFSGVTYVQRVNTAGGLKPSTPGIQVGEERRVPYTAEYYFYCRSSD